MIRVVAAVVVALVGALVVVGRAPGLSLQALQSPPVVKVCDLLPRAEVKKLIGGNQIFDMIAPEEEALGSYGSSCNYPGVMIQVLPFQSGTIEAARKRGGLAAVPGIGDEAHQYENPAGYLELYVKVGPRLLTLQRDISSGQTSADVRPGTIELARALVAKLR
jgi:hypothetical protein